MDKIRLAVFAHVRAGVLLLHPVGPLPDKGWTVTLFYQFSTVPPSGGRSVYWPPETYSWGQGTRSVEEVPICDSLVAVSPLIRAVDIQGPVPQPVVIALFQLNLNLILVRMDEFFPDAECTDDDDDTIGRAYTQLRNPPYPIWLSSPLNHRTTSGGRTIDSSAATIHVDLCSITHLLCCLDGLPVHEIERLYIILFPGDAPIDQPFCHRILRLLEFLNVSITLVGFEALIPFKNRKNANPRGLWDEFLNSDLLTEETSQHIPRQTPSFLTYDQYAAQFGHDTHRFHPPNL